MRRSRMVALTGAVALATTALGGTTATAALHTTTTTAATASAAASTGSGTYVVLADRGADVRAIAAALRKSGATVTSVNTDIGLVSVRSTSAGFLRTARGSRGVKAAANDGVVGRSPDAGRVQDRVLKEHQASPSRSSGHGKAGKKGAKADPLDASLWGMDMIDAPQAQPVELGNKKVKVGVMDTGVDGTHPDIAPNFDRKLSRNFATDMPDIDGPCEHASCVDPVERGRQRPRHPHRRHHGGGAQRHRHVRHRARRHARQRPRRPGQRLLLPQRHGQRAHLLRQRRPRRRQHVVLRRPVALQLQGRRPGGRPGAGRRAGRHHRGDEPGARLRAPPRASRSWRPWATATRTSPTRAPTPTSPDYPGGTEHLRTIDNANCLDLPVEGPHVIGVSSLGPSERKADYSN